MNNKPLLTIYQAFRNYANSCPADETIGIRVATKFLRYCLKKQESFNLELKNRQLERENNMYKEHIKKLKLRVDDLEEDNKTLTERNKSLSEFDANTEKIYRNYEEGFHLVEVDAWDVTAKVYVNAPKTFIEKNIDEALRQSIPNKKPKYPLDYTRQQLINFFRKSGFNAK